MYGRDEMFNPNSQMPEVDQIDQDIAMMERRRQQLLNEAQIPKLPPVEQTLVALAHEAGEMGAMYRTERERRERAVAKLDEVTKEAAKVPDLQRMVEYYTERATVAEEKLAKKRKRK